MTKKKLAILLSRFPYPLEKGDKLRAYHQIKYLSNFFEIHLYCLEITPTSEEDKRQLKPYCRSIQTYRLNRGRIAYEAFRSFFRSEPVQVGYFFSKEIHEQIQDAIKNLNPDIVYAQLSRMAHYAAYLPFPKVFDFQDAFSLNYRRMSKQWIGIKRWFYAREGRCMGYFEQWVLKKFDATLIISEPDKNAIDEHIHVIPNGVDIHLFKPGSQAKEFDLLFLGNLSYPPNQKAVMFLVKKILPKLLKSKPDIKIQIVGAGLTNHIRNLESKNVRIVGWVDEAVQAYQKSSLFVAPLFSGAGMQNKVLEAMSCGLPVLTTSIVNASIGANDKEHIVLADDEDEFVEQILQLLDHPERQHELGGNAREFISGRFQWEVSNEKLRKLLEEVSEKTKTNPLP